MSQRQELVEMISATYGWTQRFASEFLMEFQYHRLHPSLAFIAATTSGNVPSEEVPTTNPFLPES